MAEQGAWPSYDVGGHRFYDFDEVVETIKRATSNKTAKRKIRGEKVAPDRTSGVQLLLFPDAVDSAPFAAGPGFWRRGHA